jgi:hypothetical protein
MTPNISHVEIILAPYFPRLVIALDTPYYNEITIYFYKAIFASGALPPNPHRGTLPPNPRWGPTFPQTPQPGG